MTSRKKCSIVWLVVGIIICAYWLIYIVIDNLIPVADENERDATEFVEITPEQSALYDIDKIIRDYDMNLMHDITDPRMWIFPGVVYDSVGTFSHVDTIWYIDFTVDKLGYYKRVKRVVAIFEGEIVIEQEF